MDLTIIIDGAWTFIQGASLIVAGASAYLRFVAPLTKNTWDDRWQVKLEKALQFLSMAEKSVSGVKVTIKKK